MYKINDKSAAVKLIQNYLAALDGKTSAVVPSGVFDDNTKISVKNFQKTNGIPESGIVDKKTLDLLYYEYSRKLSKRHIPEHFIFPMKLGDYGEEIALLNNLIKEMLDYYGLYHSINGGRYYSKEIEKGVRRLREIFHLPLEDVIDEEFYIRLLEEQDSTYIFRQNI